MAEIGSVIDGKYEILTEIGHGGMSVVYLAMDTHLNKQWAVKEIKKKGSGKNDEIVVNSLLAEANMMKRLDHPSLPRIVDIIDNGITIYVVMDYIEGESLDKILAEYGAQPEELVIGWAKQLCDALSYLHSQKPPIIYRDMKPANVMLKPEGNIKIIDFGIAREYKEQSLADTTVLGTKGYAPPEQYSGQTDARSDIYALGMTMHHLLTGIDPRTGEAYAPVRMWNPEVSEGMEMIIDKCVQPAAEHRYQNCQDLLYDLEHPELITRDYKRKQKRKLNCFITSVTLAVVMVISGVVCNIVSTRMNNSDGREINRSLKSIKAELLKRQSLFAEANVNHIDKYIQLYKNGKVKIPLPHLIIIVDEFAELKAEQPEFMKELISAARIGRSLGVHLILATQKPSGQVNEQIWSNSKFRLCLKVQNKEDSNEVLKSPLAAEIKEPGRAYLQVGNNEIFELLQSGFSGALEKANTSKEKSYIISQVDISGRKRIVYAKKKANSSKSSRTQLEAIVDYVRDTCIENGIERLQNICLPPLPSIVNIVETNKGNGMVSIGIYDDPDSQYQGDAFINISNENYMIIGSSGTGKTNFLQVIIRQIVNCYSPKQANIYIMDFGAMYLKNFQDLCYVGGVVTISEEEKLKNLFKLLVEEISARKEKFLSIGISSYSSYEEGGFEDIPRIFVLLDNYTAFREIYGDTYEEEFIYILREGLACGVNVILSNSQTSGLGYKYMSNFAGRIALHCNDSSEYSTLFDRCRMQPKDEVGRALCMMNKEIYETQMFLAFEGEKEIDRSNTIKKYVSAVNSQNEGVRAKAIPEIPEVLLIDYIENNYRNCQVKYKYPVALNYEDVDLVSIDFEKINELSIVGNESSRRLGVLKSLLFSMEYYVLENTFNLYIIDDVNRQLKDFKEKMYTEEYTLDYSRIGEIIIDLEEKFEERYNLLLQNEGGEKIRMPLQIVVINSKEAIEYISSNKQILERYNKLVKQYKALGISFIYSNIEDVNVPYGAPEILKRQKENKKVLITTSKLKDFKFCELQSSVVRNMKSLEFGDAYFLDGTDISRIKILEVK